MLCAMFKSEYKSDELAENEGLVLFFESSAYKGVNTLYLLNPMEADLIFKNIQITPDDTFRYEKVRDEEVRAVLTDFIEIGFSSHGALVKIQQDA